jgi:hypothetical protein
MSRILGNGSENKPTHKAGVKGLVVKGLAYRNSAAKFWASLMDEVMKDFPECDGVALRGLCGGTLTPELLSPETLLQQSLQSIEDTDLSQVFHDTLLELELLGPPPPVEITLLSGGKEVTLKDLPLDWVDADLLPFLLVWLLEWAEISEFLWNRADIKGDVNAEDADRQHLYAMHFVLHNRHLSEGLFERKVELRFKRESAPGRPAHERASA